MRRGASGISGISGILAFLVTIFAFTRRDKNPGIRQLYEIAELGGIAPTDARAPKFIQLTAQQNKKVTGEDLDFRDEILAHLYNAGDPKPQRPLIFDIAVTDEGEQVWGIPTRWEFKNWKRIGRIEFKEAVASYNGDFVLHFHHPKWRE